MRRDAKASSATTVSRPGSSRARRAVLATACLCALALLAFLGIGTSAAMATPPTLTINPVTNVGFASAHLSGEVEVAADGYETYWCLEYAEEGTLNWSGFCYQGPIQPGETKSVERDLSGLKPGTHYEARLSALNFTEFAAEHSGVQTFTTEATNPPEAEIDPASAITGSSAHLSGTVNSGGSGPGEKAGTYRFTCSPSCPGIEGSHNFQTEGFADGADHAVEANATGLLPNTQYTVTLTAKNAAGEESDQTIFTTDAIAPEAITAFVAPRTTTTARLNAYIIPNNSDTTFYFQYGPSDCSANPCTSVPLSEDATVSPSDMGSHLVSEEVSGLSESTTYHYRVVAESAGGTSTGADKTFETRSAAEMTLAPRGYELVNDPDKGNQNVLPMELGDRWTADPQLSRFSSSADGETAGWTTFAGSPGATTSNYVQFLSTRGPNGWSTTSVAGPAATQYGGGKMNFKLVRSTADFSHFILSGNIGVFGFGDAVLVRAARGGEQELLYKREYVQGTSIAGGFDVSADLRHVITLENGSLYDYGSGTPKVVGLMADDQPPACGVSQFYTAGHFPGYSWISTDGMRIFFRSKGDNCAGPDGVYMRNRETEDTTQLTPDGEFLRATPDGRAALFLTRLQLDPNDPNSTRDLYRWEEGSGSRCLTCRVPNAELQAIPISQPATIDTSEHLERTYFASPNKLTPDAPGAGTYVVLADGSIHYAGSLAVRPNRRMVVEGNNDDQVSLTPDGRGVLINTKAHLTTDEIGKCPESTDELCDETYYYDDETRSIECISCVPGGTTHFNTYREGVAISDDGSTIAFSTRSKLVPADVNGVADIYQWHNGKLGLITDGVTKFVGGDLSNDQTAPTVHGVSADGRDIFFTLTAPLTGYEHDNLANFYDARIGGGFPPPSPPVHCDGDSCQGALQTQPPPIRSASSTFSGNGNATGMAPRCRGAKLRRKGRCVSKRARCRKVRPGAKHRCAKPRTQKSHMRPEGNNGGGVK